MTPLHDLGELIQTRVTDLQQRYLRDHNASAAAQLAQLRQGVGRPPGSVPAIWDLTLADIPRQGRGDSPSASESAAHVALTLYAVHQQSQRLGMHKPGISLGAAVRDLVLARARANGTLDPDRERAVRRRFDALLTSAGFDEAVQHLRGLVSQFRAEEVRLDYGRLAEDLERLGTSRGFDAVRRAWGRDYHARRPSRAAGQDGEDASNPSGSVADSTTEPPSEEDQ